MKKNINKLPVLRRTSQTLSYASLCARTLHLAVSAAFFSLALCTAGTAADFTGSLKGVTITDAAGTNKPPAAVFTYTQIGNVFTFDAGGSSDTDGSIVKYKWDFGDGTTSEGPTATYTLPATTTASLQVTLTVVDNSNGAALSQQTIIPTGAGIVDDFVTDTAANYIRVLGTGTLAVTAGYAHISAANTGRTVFYHKTTIGKPDQIIDYSSDLVDASNQTGVAFRVNPTNKTAYVTYFDASKLYIRGMNLSNGSWTGLTLVSAATYLPGKHSVTISITGNKIIATVDGVEAINSSQTIYTAGDYAGIVIYRAGGDPKIYDFKARTN